MSYIIKKAKKEGIKSSAKFVFNRIVREVINWKPVWTPRQVYIPLSSVKVEDPVFFLGTQGGGLTLVSRMLRRCGEFATIGGGPSFWTGNDEMDKFQVHSHLLPDEFALRSPGYHNMTGEEKDHPVFGYERSWVYATDELLPQYRKTKQDHSEVLERRFRNYIRRSIRAHSRDGESARFLDMSQSYSLKIPLLREIFPSARFIVVVRNPYAMCWREVTRRPDQKYCRWSERPSLERGLRLAAQHWANTYALALSDLRGMDEGLVVHFEDILRHPKKHMREISDHVAVPYTDDMIPQEDHRIPLGSKEKSKWYPIREGVNNKYLKSVTSEAIEVVSNTIEGRYRIADYDDVIRRYKEKTSDRSFETGYG